MPLHGEKSGQPGGKILTLNPSPEDSLSRLTKGLHSLLDLAQKGEWERLDEELEGLLQIMEILRSTEFRPPASPGKRAQIEQSLQLLKAATDLCSTRKDQITPLINAFVQKIDAPTQP